MKKIKLPIPPWGAGQAFATFDESARWHVQEHEEKIHDIAIITGKTPEEVEEFYKTHSFTLDGIRQAVLMGAELDVDNIRKTMAENSMGSIYKTLGNLVNKKTWKDYLSDIPYYIGYYMTYPFMWSGFWLWEGVRQAKEEVWD